jgi:O-acetyl-ADP-ribose deacetylase (regulator of RNase III)
MPIKYIKGDIFDISNTRKIIAHSVNCRGVFGAGFALEISKRYPEAKQAYINKYHFEGWKPGEIQMVALAEKTIVNMALQYTYGRKGVHTQLDACKTAFDKLFNFCSMRSREFDISMPKVGSGLGGQEWKRVEEILIDCLQPYGGVAVDIYYL